MKIITASLVALLFFLLTIYLTVQAVESFNMSNQLFIEQGTDKVQSFKLAFIIITLLLSILIILTASLFCAYVHKTSRALDEYLQKRRDNQIKSKLNEREYEELYNELSKTNDVAIQNSKVEQFYAQRQESTASIVNNNTRKRLEDLVDSIRGARTSST